MHHSATKAEELFYAALEFESPGDRSAFLDRACGSAELRRRVERLLALVPEANDFFEAPAPLPTETVAHESCSDIEEPGTVIGPYKLLEPIGEGGMGTVYMAEQAEPVRRRVALKVIKPGMDSRQVVARFEAERQALAMMDHPNIARVLDGGMTPSGRPYFVMELVRGLPITEYCDRHQLSIARRLELFVLVCRAVQHAHQKGVIHRDIKPSNVLVTDIDGVAVPKVIDFGVAKATGCALTDKTLFTGFHQFVGTPLYTSPEQAAFSGADVDTRSDIYSLGVLLYELLTGTTPFDSETLRRAAFDEMRRILREEEPPRPSTRLSTLGERLTTVSAQRKADPRRLGLSLRGELDWVVMKALEKDRRRRYETANDFAADVLRYLTDQPVEARPPSTGYRLRKFLRRNRGPVAAGAALAGLLAAGAVGTSLGLVWALREKDRATAAETKAQEEAAVAKAVNDFLREDLLAQASPGRNARDRVVTVDELLDRAAERIGGRFAGQPRVEAEIRMTIGNAYNNLGDYAAAQPHIERAYELGRSVLGAERPRTLDFMNNLAGLYMNRGDFARAEPLLVRALEVSRRVRGDADPETINLMNNLSYCYNNQGKPARAEPLLVEALEVSRRASGEGNPGMIAPLRNLAQLYEGQRKFAQAEALRVKAVEIAHRRWGDENLVTLGAKADQGILYMDQGKLTEAEPLLVKPLEVYRRVLGKEHPNTLQIMHNLAMLYERRGELAKAEPLLVEVVEVGRPILGATHPDMVTAAINLADVYSLSGKADHAIPLLEVVLNGTRGESGPDHPGLPAGQLIKIAALLGPAYEQASQLAKAEPLYREALETARRQEREASPDFTLVQVLLGMNLLKQQRYAEAEPLLREGLKFREQNQPDSWATYNTKSQLGGSLLGQKNYDEAEPLLLAGYEGLKRREEAIPPLVREVRLAEAVERLVQLYEATGRPDQAATWRAKRPAMEVTKPPAPQKD